MPDWKATNEQVAWLKRLAISDDIAAMNDAAAKIADLLEDIAAKKTIQHEAEDTRDYAEGNVLLSGAVTGKNETERKAQLAQLVRQDAVWKAAHEALANATTDLLSLEARLKSQENRFAAARAALNAKAGIMGFLGSTSS